MNRAIKEAVHRQVRSRIRVCGRGRVIDVDAQAWLIPLVQEPVGELVGTNPSVPDDASGAGRHRPQSGQASRRGLPLVVGDEGVDWREVDRRGDMDRVQGSERRLGQCARRQEQNALERQQPERIDDLSGTSHQAVKIQSRIVGGRAPDRSRDLSQH